MICSIQIYGCNMYEIIQMGHEKFSRRMLKTAFGVPVFLRIYHYALQCITSFIFLLLEAVKRYLPLQEDLV